MMPSYVLFGFDADSVLAGYLFNVIDRVMATALTAFRVMHPRLSRCNDALRVAPIRSAVKSRIAATCSSASIIVSQN
jgi:hypothetical protein